MNQKLLSEKESDKKDLPHKILGLIFDDKPEGVSVGEIKSILNEAREIAESFQMVPEAEN